jgi:glycerophosphoryl diester phosphodiesterase/type 1 glutamine amidotransferase
MRQLITGLQAAGCRLRARMGGVRMVATAAGVLAVTTFAAMNTAQSRPHVVFVTGDDEYRSEITMPMIAAILEKQGFRTSVARAVPRPQVRDNIEGLEAVDSADLMVMFTRFRALPDAQLKHIENYVASGKPMVGLRTTTHAFLYPKDNPHAALNDGFGTDIFGQKWITHHGHSSSTDVALIPAAREHPILRGVTPFHATSWLYHVAPLAGEGATLLLEGSSVNSNHTKRPQYPPLQPVAWTRTYKGARVFFTTLGHPADFEQPSMRRLLVNGIHWALGRDVPAGGANVDTVGPWTAPEGFDLGAEDKREKSALAARTRTGGPWLVAHRGASAYTPENTVPAFTLAAEQGATFVEFDLQLTKDGQLVALHDNSLERTTDVEELFPTRFRETKGSNGATKRWMLEDFTLEEVRRLDAGAWFDAKFRGTKVPTFAETIDSLRGRSGLYIEIKSPERYPGIEKKIIDELAAKGLAEPGADPKTPVLLQSFSAASLKIFSQTLATRLPVHFLVGARDAAPWMTPEGLWRVKAFATGLSPEKAIVLQQPDIVARAKAMGMLVTPYTFRSGAVTGYPDVTAEMQHYLTTVGVDGVITDNPDKLPGR